MKTASNIVSRLDSLISLKEQVKVYVPSTFDIDQKIDNSFFVNEVQKRLSNLFGGATSYKADGSWITSDNVLVNENITVIVAFTSQLDNIAKDEVLTICEWLKNELKQEAVSMELNNELYFV